MIGFSIILKAHVPEFAKEFVDMAFISKSELIHNFSNSAVTKPQSMLYQTKPVSGDVVLECFTALPFEKLTEVICGKPEVVCHHIDF